MTPQKKEVCRLSPLNEICDVSRMPQEVCQFFCHCNHTRDVIVDETSLIILRRKNWRKSFVEEKEWEKDDRPSEPVDNVLNHLKGTKSSDYKIL
jgi:hypothetical protein